MCLQCVNTVWICWCGTVHVCMYAFSCLDFSCVCQHIKQSWRDVCCGPVAERAVCIDWAADGCKLTELVSLSAGGGDMRSSGQTRNWVFTGSPKQTQPTLISGVNGWQLEVGVCEEGVRLSNAQHRHTYSSNCRLLYMQNGLWVGSMLGSAQCVLEGNLIVKGLWPVTNVCIMAHFL